MYRIQVKVKMRERTDTKNAYFLSSSTITLDIKKYRTPHNNAFLREDITVLTGERIYIIMRFAVVYFGFEHR